MRAIREETVVCVFCFLVPSDPAEKILNASGQTEAGFDLLQKVCIVCYCKVYSVACIVQEKVTMATQACLSCSGRTRLPVCVHRWRDLTVYATNYARVVPCATTVQRTRGYAQSACSAVSSFMPVLCAKRLSTCVHLYSV